MRSSLSFSLLVIPCIALPQFYPDSSATWCLQNAMSPDGFNIHMQYVAPDVSFGGNWYKHMQEFYDDPGQWILYADHYVRSSPDGKGYAYLPDSAAEYLTGDAAAQPGDTVQDVLVVDNIGCPDAVPTLVDVIVDSVVTLTNNGVTVTRHYVHVPCYTQAMGYYPSGFFWQAGMGTSQGPKLQMNYGLTMVGLLCAQAAGIHLYYNGLPHGLPGIQCGCAPLVNGIAGLSDGAHVMYPNPTTGHFTMEFEDPLMAESHYSVYDGMGRLLYQRSLPTGATIEEIDLSRYGKGTYAIKLTHPDGVRHERVVLE